MVKIKRRKTACIYMINQRIKQPPCYSLIMITLVVTYLVECQIFVLIESKKEREDNLTMKYKGALIFYVLHLKVQNCIREHRLNIFIRLLRKKNVYISIYLYLFIV